MNRRRLLSRAAVTGAGLAAVRPLASAGAATADTATSPYAQSPEFDPGFVAGTVVASSRGTLSVSDIDGKADKLRLGVRSNIWKRAVWNTDAVAKGDCIYARGARAADGALEIDRAWMNIASFSATVLGLDATQLVLRTDKDEERRVAIAATSEVETPRGDIVRGSASSLAPSQGVQVVGYQDLAGGRFVASKVVLFMDTVQAADSPSVSAAAVCTQKGVTSWFCCGSPAGCGQCGGNGCGSCTDNCCKNNANHCAWPKLQNGCGVFCSNCCVDASYPRIGCGTDVFYVNPCNGLGVTARVKDCGPTIRCVSPNHCEGQTKVKFDLTPCAFSVIGNLNDGILNVHAVAPC